jgi:hypothetical protein
LANPLDGQVEKFEGGGIRPVCVLEEQQDGLLPSKTLELIEERRERLAALLRGAERERRISFAKIVMRP